MRSLSSTVLPVLISLLLTACGGGGGGGADGGAASKAAVTVEPGAPQATGDTATDGLNWFNFRRQQLGVQTMVRNTAIDTAAQRHSDYQKINRTITHQEIVGKPGFSGVQPGDRLTAAGYQFAATYAYGEVISSTYNTSGFSAAEDLIAAIYHRFVVFEPTFREVGTGAATVSGAETYFTTDFTANGSLTGLGVGQVVVYPVPGQQQIPVNFFSDNELPDPVPGRNEVGYPVSVHANITASLTTQSFTIQPRGGSPLAVRLLKHDVDTETPNSAAAIVPLDVLQAGTTYDVQFAGTVNGVAVQRAWSFTTR